MYIISIDFGSTNSKAVILNVCNEEIKLVAMERSNETVQDKFISFLLEKHKINEDNVEKIVVTGTGSSFLSEKYKNIDIAKVSEFDAIGYGGLILSKLEEGIVVSIGTGTAIVYSNMTCNKHIGGTGLGGGTLVGLSKKVIDIKNENVFLSLIDMAKHGKKENVDLMICDINKGDIGKLKLNITASNFAGFYKESNDNDYVAGIVNMILENICLLISQVKINIDKEKNKNLPIIFIGTMVTDEYIMKLIKNIGEFTGNKYVFVENADFAIAIGAYEYYLMNLRSISDIMK